MNRFCSMMLGTLALLVLGSDAYAMYHPVLGRFCQRDPLGYVDGMSAYEYCRSATIGGLDPDGEADIRKGGWMEVDILGTRVVYAKNAETGECFTPMLIEDEVTLACYPMLQRHFNVPADVMSEMQASLERDGAIIVPAINPDPQLTTAIARIESGWLTWIPLEVRRALRRRLEALEFLGAIGPQGREIAEMFIAGKPWNQLCRKFGRAVVEEVVMDQLFRGGGKLFNKIFKIRRPPTARFTGQMNRGQAPKFKLGLVEEPQLPKVGPKPMLGASSPLKN